MNAKIYAVIVTGLAVAAAWTPVSAANREYQQIMADIRMLQEQTQQLQLTLLTLTDALKTVTTRIDDQAGVTRKAFADQKVLFDSVAGDLRVVREKVDETNVRISALAQDVEAIRAMPPPAPAPPTDPTQAGTPAGAAPSAPVDPAAAPPAPSPAVTIAPSRLYEMARADYMAGQYTLAIQGFETYLKTFPKSELADDAQWYIGESYFTDAKDKEAVAAYDRVIAEYSGGNRVADAYYKRGLALMRLGEGNQAIESWETVVKKFPDTQAATLAKQGLDRNPRKK